MLKKIRTIGIKFRKQATIAEVRCKISRTTTRNGKRQRIIDGWQDVKIVFQMLNLKYSDFSASTRSKRRYDELMEDDVTLKKFLKCRRKSYIDITGIIPIGAIEDAIEIDNSTSYTRRAILRLY
jgi:cytidylate kinase